MLTIQRRIIGMMKNIMQWMISIIYKVKIRLMVIKELSLIGLVAKVVNILYHHHPCFHKIRNLII